jgi:hypothetical protein
MATGKYLISLKSCQNMSVEVVGAVFLYMGRKGETIMNMHEGLVLVDDEEGRAFICTLDHKCSEFVCKLDGNRKIPNKLDDLSEHERRSCIKFFGIIP